MRRSVSKILRAFGFGLQSLATRIEPVRRADVTDEKTKDIPKIQVRATRIDKLAESLERHGIESEYARQFALGLVEEEEESEEEFAKFDDLLAQSGGTF